MEVDLDYWISRKRVEIEMARCATSPEARLVHQQLASRYGAKADKAAPSRVGLVIAQIPADFVVSDPCNTTIADPIGETPHWAAL